MEDQITLVELPLPRIFECKLTDEQAADLAKVLASQRKMATDPMTVMVQDAIVWRSLKRDFVRSLEDYGRKGLHPSGAGRCWKQAAYTLQMAWGVPIEKDVADAETAYRLEYGNASGIFMANCIADLITEHPDYRRRFNITGDRAVTVEELKVELVLPELFNVVGRIDQLIRVGDIAEAILLEHKATKATFASSPKVFHEIQAGLYATILAAKGWNIKGVWVVQSSPSFAPHASRVDMTKVQQFLSYAKKTPGIVDMFALNRAPTNQEVAGLLGPMDSWECDYCFYRTHCQTVLEKVMPGKKVKMAAGELRELGEQVIELYPTWKRIQDEYETVKKRLAKLNVEHVPVSAEVGGQIQTLTWSERTNPGKVDMDVLTRVLAEAVGHERAEQVLAMASKPAYKYWVMNPPK